METVYSEFKENRMNIDDIDTIDLNACTDAELNDLLDQVLIKVDYYKHGVSGAITAALNKKAFDSNIEKAAAAIDPAVLEYLMKNKPAAQSTEVAGLESQSGFGFDNK